MSRGLGGSGSYSFGVPRFMAAQAQVDDVVDLVAGDQLLGFGPVQRPLELLAPESAFCFGVPSAGVWA